MNDDLNRHLGALANRGTPRGADDVLRAARSGGVTSRSDHPGRRLVLAAAVLAVVAIAAYTLGSSVDDPPETSAGRTTTSSPPRTDAPVQALNASSLVLFDDCAALLRSLQARGRDHVGPTGLPGMGGWGMYLGGEGDSGAFVQQRFSLLQRASGLDAAAPGTSGTNTQEVGVDEPDIVESDGEHLFVVRDGSLRVVDIASATLTATVSLGLVNITGAMLVGHALVVLANEPLSNADRGEAKVVVVDVAGSPVVRERLTANGVLVDARVVDGRVHVVLASSPTLAFTYPVSGEKGAEDAATAANRERIDASTIDDWVPHWRVTDGAGATTRDDSRITACDEVRHPQSFAGFDETTLLTLDLDHLTNSKATAVVAASQLVYGSTDSVYVATTSYDDLVGDRPVSGGTDVHRFSIDGKPTYAASGRIEGFVSDQFGLSEHAGHLRVASTTYTTAFGGGVESRVTVLVERDGELVTTGVVSGLGVGEDIQGVRFLGDIGYLVTFRRTDPLFVLDLHDPVAPRLAGQIKVPGYSAYLHPVGDGLVLGVGHDGTESGRLTGAAVSLFDVRDPSAPERADLERFGQLASPVTETDHHAFTWLPETGTAYVPVGVAGSPSRIEVVAVEGDSLRLVGAVEPGAGAPPDALLDRVVVAGDRLLSVSADGVQVSDRATLAPIAWVPFDR